MYSLVKNDHKSEFSMSKLQHSNGKFFHLFFLEMPSSPILTNINVKTVRKLETTLRSEENFLILLSYFDQKAWIRMSANIYNSYDFVKLRDRLATFLQIANKI